MSARASAIRSLIYAPAEGFWVCPVNPSHRLSADKRPATYYCYCYACGEYYYQPPGPPPPRTTE